MPSTQTKTNNTPPSNQKHSSQPAYQTVRTNKRTTNRTRPNYKTSKQTKTTKPNEANNYHKNTMQRSTPTPRHSAGKLHDAEAVLLAALATGKRVQRPLVPPLCVPRMKASTTLRSPDGSILTHTHLVLTTPACKKKTCTG